MADTKILQAVLDKLSSLETKIDIGFKEVNKRIDKIGFQLSNLEDDAPTNEEFEKLEKRVSKLENHFATS